MQSTNYHHYSLVEYLARAAWIYLQACMYYIAQNADGETLLNHSLQSYEEEKFAGVFTVA